MKYEKKLINDLILEEKADKLIKSLLKESSKAPKLNKKQLDIISYELKKEAGLFQKIALGNISAMQSLAVKIGLKPDNYNVISGNLPEIMKLRNK